MATEDNKRTLHAQAAFQFSDVFGYKFANLSFGESPSRRLKLNEPEMSTDGGRKARQSIVLTPEAEGSRTLVCGWVDVPRKTGELRSYNLISQQFEQRYSTPLDISRDEYDRVIRELSSFFKIQNVQSTVIDAPARIRAPSKAEPSPSAAPLGAMVAMLVIGILIGFGLGYLVFHLRVFGATG
jgi:hypothetical protein